MTRWGAFAFGAVVGIVLMQFGHALYLRSGDYLWASFFTVMFGTLAVGFGNCFED